MTLRHLLINYFKKNLWKNEKITNCFDSFFNFDILKQMIMP